MRTEVGPAPGTGFVLGTEEAVDAFGSGEAAAVLTLLHQHYQLLLLRSPRATSGGAQERAGATGGFSHLRCSPWWGIFSGGFAEKEQLRDE